MSELRRCANCEAELGSREWAGGQVPYCSGCDSWWNERAIELAWRHRKGAPVGSTVSFSYEPNGTDHDDVVLRLGRWAHRSDSYYYVLDGPDPATSMRALLQQWRAMVEAAGDASTLLLPHDFSDQSTGWLQCTIAGGDVVVVDGWSAVEGYSLYPSDFAETARQVHDFTPHDDCAPVRMSREQLRADIQRSWWALRGADEP